MRLSNFRIVILLAAGLLCVNSFAQNARWYFGSSLGAQQWRGPLNANVGVGGEATIGRYFSEHSALAFVAGFASLPFQESSVNNGVKFILVPRESNLFYGDFLFDIHPFGRGKASPYLRFGSGLMNVQVGSATRKNYAAGVLGAGLLFGLNRDIAINLSGNYHHAVGQTLAGFDSNKNPEGYWGARAGLIFSTRSGDSGNEEPWFTTSEEELSPFVESSKQEPAVTPAPKENASPATTQTEQLPPTEGFEEEEDEKPLVENDEEQPEQVLEESKIDEENLSFDDDATPEHAAIPPEDAFSKFNRKVDQLAEETQAAPPARIETSETVLSDEPPFESFYPPVKQNEVESFKEKLFNDEPASEARESVESEASQQVSSFEERLAKLEEQEDFLSPDSEEAERVKAERTTALREESQNENALPRRGENLTEANDVPIPEAPNFSAFESRLHELDNRAETIPEEEEPVVRKDESLPYERFEQENQFKPLQQERPAPIEQLAQEPALSSNDQPAKQEPPQMVRKDQAAPHESIAQRPAPARPERGSQPDTPRPQKRERTSTQSPAPRLPQHYSQEEQELLELRALLDKLEDRGSSRSDGEDGATQGLTLRSHDEVEELRLRLDELTGYYDSGGRGASYADNQTSAREEIEEENFSEAFEAFKDRLGLLESEPKQTAPVEWDQQNLKSQINDIDKELAQKEEDLSAIRTALAQSAANGAAFPARAFVTRGSFAQGYEGALHSFYMLRYEDAISKLSELLEQYPSHTLTSNCYYWLGEAQFGYGDYPAAIASFGRVLAFERSLKKDNALLMLGRTYLAMKRPTDARAAFNRLLSEYPVSDAVAKAQELMKSM